ncbi:hypothetical protein ACS0TY_033202 [Phlomoides rotata]
MADQHQYSTISQKVAGQLQSIDKKQGVDWCSLESRRPSSVAATELGILRQRQTVFGLV